MRVAAAVLPLLIIALTVTVPLASGQALQPTWTQKCSRPGPQATYFPAMAYDSARQQMVLFGGANLSAANPFVDETWVWDGLGWTQKSPANKPPARSAHLMAFDAARSQIVVFGGSVGGPPGNDTWVWDGTTWTQKFPATNPPARLSAGMVYDSALQKILLMGGSDGSPNALSDTWAWDGTNWTQLASAPITRSNFAVAYDEIRHQTVVFGGRNAGGYLGDTSIFDGTNWTSATLAGSPPIPRQDDRMAFDASLGQIILFGGSGPNNAPLYGDTWTWNGTAWSPASPAASPQARTSHTMAYDAANSHVVLFGGYVAPTLTFPGDTWVYGAPTTAGCTLQRLGIDLSGSAGPLNSSKKWEAFSAEGSIGVVVDAWGGRQENPFAADQLHNASKAGFKTAAFCLLSFDRPDGMVEKDGQKKWSGAWQVDKAFQAVGDERQNLAFLALDIEDSLPLNLSISDRISRIQEAIQQVIVNGLKPVIYTDRSQWPLVTGFKGNTPSIFTSYPLWDSFNDFLPSLSVNGPYAPGCPSGQTGQSLPWVPYGGWLNRVGKQYNIGCNRRGTSIDSVLVDLDVFDGSLFGLP